MNLTSPRNRCLLMAIAGPPLILTVVLISTARLPVEPDGWVGTVVRALFYFLPLLSYYLFARALRLWARPIVALALAPVYLCVMFWVTAGVAMYGVFFTYGVYD